MPKNGQGLLNRETKISKNPIFNEKQHDGIDQNQHNIDDKDSLIEGADVIVVGEGERVVDVVGDGEDGFEGI